MKRDFSVKANHSLDLGQKKIYFSNEYRHFAQTMSDSVSFFCLVITRQSLFWGHDIHSTFFFPFKAFSGTALGFYSILSQWKKKVSKGSFHVPLIYKKRCICHCLLQSMSFYILVFKTSQRGRHGSSMAFCCQRLSFDDKAHCAQLETRWSRKNGSVDDACFATCKVHHFLGTLSFGGFQSAFSLLSTQLLTQRVYSNLSHV